MFKRLCYEDILVNGRRKSRTNTALLRRAMFEYGFPYQCGICGCSCEWNSNNLLLQIDHIDGDFLNNSPENLRFLCPNCHSQTDTYGSKNRGRLSDADFDAMYW
jgi:5-methylcytosine-specific restriction endonuclease McrA